MQHWHIELLPEVFFDLVLKAVEYGVAEWAGGHHCFGPTGLGCKDVLPGELDSNALVMARGMEPATLSSPAVVDRTASQDFRKLLDRRVVARVDKTIAARRTGDVAAIESGDGKPGERIGDQRAQPFRADLFVQHPQEVGYLGSATVMQIFLCQPGIDSLRKFGIANKGGMRVEYIKRAGVADRHQG